MYVYVHVFLTSCIIHNYIECPCNANGTDNSICNATTGQCHCRPGAVGDCSVCSNGLWGATRNHGCIECGCCTNGTMFNSSSCDQVITVEPFYNGYLCIKSTYCFPK